jgi:hypothetical protein
MAAEADTAVALRHCARCDYGQRPCAGACACLIDKRDIRDHAAAGFCPHPQSPRFGTAEKPQGWEDAKPQPSRGLGDTIKKITSAVGFKSCAGCKERAEKLNRMFPYGKDGIG